MARAPAVDLALDRLGDVGAEQFPDVLVDRRDEIRARAIDDRLQPLAKFPYSVFYSIYPNGIRILAIAH